MNKLMQKLVQAKVSLNQISAVIVTHEHQDHFRGVSSLVRTKKVYGSQGTMRDVKASVNRKIIRSGKSYLIGDLVVVPFEVKHDAREPLNFAIKASGGQFLLYITDTGTVDIKMPNIRPTYIIIESNYDEDALREKIEKDDGLNPYLTIHRKRNLMLDTGHLSIQKTITILEGLKLGLCEKIALCHISQANNTEKFGKQIEDKFGIQVIELSPTETITSVVGKTKIPF